MTQGSFDPFVFLEALNKLTEIYAKIGKTVRLRYLSEDCRKFFDNVSSIIDVNYLEDPKYKLAVDAPEGCWTIRAEVKIRLTA